MSQGDRTIIVPSPWGYRRMTVRCPYDFMGPTRASCGDLADSLRLSQESTIILGQNDNLKPCVVLTIIVRCPYEDRTMSLRCVYGLTIFSNLSLCGVKQNRRGHDARKSDDDRKVSLRRPHGDGDLDIVGASYTRLKANVTEA